MNFDLSIDPWVWICLAVAAIAAILALWTRFVPIWLAGSAVKEEYDAFDSPSGEMPDNRFYSDRENLPMVSVVVYSFTEEEELDAYLERAMSQDYPNFEIILVNEGSSETTATLASRLKQQYPDNLYVTFIPSDAHNLSRRKLAETVGIKAAKGDVVLTTASNCIIPSRRWLSDMMEPFVTEPQVDVVLGYSHVDFKEMHGAWKWYRQMDATLTACQWLGSAVVGQPYRGDCYNLAFRRQLFFDNKGYSKTIHLVNGDDDIFLRDFATGDNTRIALSPDSILTTKWDMSANKVLCDMKERYQFTENFLPRLPFIRAGIGSLMQWILLLCAVGAAWVEWPDLMGAIVALVLLIVVWITEILIYRRTARRLQAICLWWSLPVFLLWHPVGNFIFKMRHRKQRRKNFTFA